MNFDGEKDQGKFQALIIFEIFKINDNVTFLPNIYLENFLIKCTSLAVYFYHKFVYANLRQSSRLNILKSNG